MEDQATQQPAPQGEQEQGAGGELQAMTFHDLGAHQQLDVPALKKLAADPEIAKKIIKAQEQVFAQLDKMAEVLAADLAQYQNKVEIPAGEQTMAHLARLAKKRQNDSHSRKEVAKDLLIASIVNYGNLAWEPTDRSTGWTPEQNPSTLLSLIMLGPIVVPASSPAPQAAPVADQAE
jgi:hypothetical protein